MKRIEYYDDYRVFLRDYFDDRKRRFAFFSNRYFSQKAGIKSPSLYQEVINGKRNLTGKTIEAFIKGLSLTARDALVFTSMVHYNQSTIDTERDFFLNQLKNHRDKVLQDVIGSDYYVYYAHWYNPVLRELACVIDWKDDYELLSNLLNPSIKANVIQESIELLLRLEFLTKDELGKYHQHSPAITTGKNSKASGIRSLNRQFAELGARAIDMFDITKRNISSMTVGISAESYLQIEQEIQEFKDRIRKIVDDDHKSDQVYSVNIQLFPLSNKHEGEKK